MSRAMRARAADPAVCAAESRLRLPVFSQRGSEMAFGGTGRGRMSEKVRRHFLRTSNRKLPPRDNPLGVPRAVMKGLSLEGLSNAPVFNWPAFDLRLQQLLVL